MAPRFPSPPTRAAPPGGRVRELMLGIFLVQLAFFIVLVALARPDFGRGKQVLANVTETFGGEESDRRPARGARPTRGVEGEAVLREVGTFAGRLFGERAARISGPGDELTLSLPLAVLFDTEEARVRPPGDRLFDALVAGMGALPPDRALRVTLAFPFDPTRETAEDAALLARAGAMARRMIQRGLPASAIALAEGAPAGQARVVIRIAPPSALDPASPARRDGPAPRPAAP